ncbi:MAG: ferrous iron transport protein B [Bacteroidetes bacterium]|nr:ferrous iron transport protein B [Bacteroidota bacterium]
MSQNTNTKLRVALIGNPNAGKSSLFNSLTGLKQKTGNYSGVTVDKHEGQTVFQENQITYSLSVVDLPGTYSLFAKTPDEKIACEFLINNREEIDVLIIVVDATNLKRNLLLASQAIDLKYKTVLALNMFDEAEKQNIKIDINGLESVLGVEVIPTDSRHQGGISDLKRAITRAKVSDSFFYDISFLQKNNKFNYEEYLHTVSPGNSEDINSDQLYRFNTINYIVTKFVKTPKQLSIKEATSRIDAITTHRVFGYVFLLLILFLVFQFIFFVAEYPMSWIEGVFMQTQNFISQNLPKGQLNDLFTGGILAGIGGVVMFIPQIALLFLFIGILEDSGYMARASFIMDKLMRRFGLNGKSVIPLISGTACAVPSIMATRTIGSYKERLITVFVLPLMSCSARLPVYTLIIALVYPDNSFLGVFNVKGLVLLAMYLLGFFATLATAFVMQKLIKVKETSFFVMELPVYRWPQAKNIAILVINKLKVFVLDAGKIILAISIILWFLSSHGPGKKFEEISSEIGRAESSSSGVSKESIRQLRTRQLEYSYVGRLGHFIEPVIKPLGFDWKIGIALITSFAAREVFVGTMATIYGVNQEDENTSIKKNLQNEKNSSGGPMYTMAVCWSLLLFYAFALQCMSTIATVKRETHSWKWPIAQLIFMTALAYLSSFCAYQALS